MPRHWEVTIAILVLAIVLLAVLTSRCESRHRKRRRDREGRREGYLIYPYLDLDEPGERGDYYALTSCP